ncbi:Ca(2+)-dependent cysteine protease [Acarospora aff. strigata]|nr:Ca(2+)-dependent cysteine protease [Acarospora aff. strigata]
MSTAQIKPYTATSSATYSPKPASATSTFLTSMCTWTQKRALLFACNYAGSDCPLNGCVNDAKHLSALLTDRFGFAKEKVALYADDDIHTRTSCTRAGMLTALHRLVRQSWTEQLDGVWIHFSGHGTYSPDTANEETDGKDECICPCDFDLISDDEIATILTNPKTVINACFDCCHSGTICDLPWRYIENGTCSESKLAFKSKIFVLSGCQDDQTSADAYLDGKYQGAMTAALIAVINKSPKGMPLTWLSTLRQMHAWLIESVFDQVPQLCTSGTLTEADRLL